MSTVDINKLAAKLFAESGPQPILFNRFGARPNQVAYKPFNPSSKEDRSTPALKPRNVNSVDKSTRTTATKGHSEPLNLFSNTLKFSRDVEDDFIAPVAKEFGLDPLHLRHIVLLESSGRPDIVNKKGGATGLMQFYQAGQKHLPYDKKYKTIRGKKYMLKDIRRMTPGQQSKLAIDFFKESGLKKGAGFHDIYTNVFQPVAYGKPDSYILGSHAGPKTIAATAKVNLAYDANKDGKISKGEFRQAAYDAIKSRLSPTNMAAIKKYAEERNRRLSSQRRKGGILYKK